MGRSAELKASPEYKARKRREHKKYRDIKRAKLSEIKLARGCADCGYKEHAVALDFDHQYDKKFGIGAKALVRSWTAILEEIAKCDVVCANCHRVRTHRNRTEANPRACT